LVTVHSNLGAQASCLLRREGLRPQRRSSGFTLFELLIVVGIIPLVTLGGALLLSDLNQGRETLLAHSEAHEASRNTLAQWREDVRMATRIDIAETGARATIVRLSSSGDPYEVAYAITNSHQLTRQVGRRLPTQMLCLSAADLKFEQRGNAYRISWTMREPDPIRNRRWSVQGWATPLAPSLKIGNVSQAEDNHK
jgi:prepilin-type N-terminal cleavage/methylation domain-containing protein